MRLVIDFRFATYFPHHFFMLTSSISSHVATLLSCKDKHLRLAALRFFRIHLKNNNRNFLVHLTKLEVFKPIVELTVKESRRDTLVNSSCQEFFEFMRRENIKEVIAHIMLNYEDRIKELSESRFCGQCFRGFVRRFEMNIHPPPADVEEKPPLHQPLEMRRVDADEESYFNGDDEDEDESVAPGPHPAPTPQLPTLLSPPLSRFQFGQKRRRQRPLASRYGPVSAASRSAPPRPQRRSTSRAPLPSVRSSNTARKTSSPQILKMRSSNRSSHHLHHHHHPSPPLPVVLAPPAPLQRRRRQRRRHCPQFPSLPPMPQSPPLAPVLAVDLCHCARRSAGGQRKRRTKWVSSGS
ncbi:hypothetical protein BC826DRAFT_215751 [Russula brevipes]|nr:hypothetical protein BC826DRAFT_215751 [Russula brevipes]